MRTKSNYLVKNVSAATTAYPGLDPNNPMAETLTLTFSSEKTRHRHYQYSSESIKYIHVHIYQDKVLGFDGKLTE